MNKISIPKGANSIILGLRCLGHEAYVVGGCVRDSLLGIEPHDWDIDVYKRQPYTDIENMKNILSFMNRPISGAEIKQWITYHIEHETEYSKIARSMIRYLNISDNRAYVVNLSPPGTGCGERKKKRPALIRQI